jgi:uncharacterized protein involved in outer membrane biogenesis
VLKKVVLGLFVLFVAGSAALFFWVRSVFTHENARAQLAAQLSEMLGQPVTIGSIAATIYPRITIKLGDVDVGPPAGVEIASLDVGTDFRALLSRRIEHATAKVDGAKIQLPLIPLGTSRTSTQPAPQTGSGSSSSLVELVSIDEVVLSHVEVLSRGHVLRGNIEVVPETDGTITLRRVSLHADDASIEATGRLTSLNGPTGDVTITAGELNLDRLIAFFNDFSITPASNSGAARAPEPRTAKPDLNVAIEAKRAHLAGLTLDAVSAKAHVTENDVLLKPMAFGLFGGKYNGSFDVRSVAGAPAFTFAGQVENLDVAAISRFAGGGEPITGRLSAQINLMGTGADAAAALGSLRGTARVNVVRGIVKNLGLVRAIVVATSMRGTSSTLLGASTAASSEAQTSRDEPFEAIRAMLAIGGRNATTEDLEFVGQNVTTNARGSVALNGSAVNLTGRVRLSEELTKQAGTDLVRYTRDDTGRVTLPVSVTGPVQAMSVHIDVVNLMKRAIQNRIEDEAQKAIMKGLGGLFKKPK